MNDFEKVQKDIEKALKAIQHAADILEAMPEYQREDSIFHASTVRQYNQLITAAIMLNNCQEGKQ